MYSYSFMLKIQNMSNILPFFLHSRQYPCQFCPLKFNTFHMRTKHTRVLHNPNPVTYPCEICGRLFYRKEHIKVHIDSIHTQLYRFHCTYCEKSFKTPHHLKCHIATHTGERPFKCGLCPMSFSSTSASAVHRRVHKVNNMYPCSLCSLSFVKTRLLNCHMRDEHNSPIFAAPSNAPHLVL